MTIRVVKKAPQNAYFWVFRIPKIPWWFDRKICRVISQDCTLIPPNQRGAQHFDEQTWSEALIQSSTHTRLAYTNPNFWFVLFLAVCFVCHRKSAQDCYIQVLQFRFGCFRHDWINCLETFTQFVQLINSQNNSCKFV